MSIVNFEVLSDEKELRVFLLKNKDLVERLNPEYTNIDLETPLRLPSNLIILKVFLETEFVGLIMLTKMAPDVFDVNIMLTRFKIGRIICSEFFKHIKEHTKIGKLVARVPDNLPHIHKLLKILGCKREGYSPDYFKNNDKRFGITYYGLRIN